MSGKIKMQKYQNINKGTKNMRIPHIRCTIPNLYFFDFYFIFKKFGPYMD